RANEMRRQPGKGLALAQGLAHQTEVEELKIPEPAVDQLRRAGGRPGGEVDLLDEDAREPPLGEVARHARAGHAAPDDDGVEELPAHPGAPARRPAASRSGAVAQSVAHRAPLPEAATAVTSSASDPRTWVGSQRAIAGSPGRVMPVKTRIVPRPPA